MTRRLWQLAGIGLLGTVVLAGCNKQAVKQKTPPDPLLVTKKPVEGRPRSPDADGTAWTEPTAPPLQPRDTIPATVHAGGPGLAPPVLIGVQAMPERNH